MLNLGQTLKSRINDSFSDNKFTFVCVPMVKASQQLLQNIQQLRNKKEFRVKLNGLEHRARIKTYLEQFKVK